MQHDFLHFKHVNNQFSKRLNPLSDSFNHQTKTTPSKKQKTQSTKSQIENSLSKILIFFFFTVFNKNLGITTRASINYVQEEKRKNIVANRVVTCSQANLLQKV